MLSKLSHQALCFKKAKTATIVLNGRPLASSNLKNEFEKLQKRLKEEGSKAGDQKDTGKKSMDELLKESKENAAKHEEELKKQFQNMKKQKTTLEFGDIIKELREKPKHMVEATKSFFGNISTSATSLKTKFAKTKKAEKEEPIKQETIKEENIKKEKPKEEKKKTKSRLSTYYSTAKAKVLIHVNSFSILVEQKAPNLYQYTHSFCKGVVDAWKATFPNKEDLIIAKMERIKKENQEIKDMEEKMKNMTEEERKKIQDEIPEYKRSALVAQKAEQEKKEKTLFDSVFGKMEKTEAGKQVSSLKKEIKDFAEILKEDIDANSSPTVQRARDMLVNKKYEMI